jgi:hypothetical protein
MAITIRPELEAKLRARAEAAGTSVETYLERIAHNDQAAELELEALAIEGLHSGESIEAGEPYWAAKRESLLNRHRKSRVP